MIVNRKKLFFSLAVGGVLFYFLNQAIDSKAYAHPGNTDSLGCHTCRTNCISWGYYYGEYHCHTPKSYLPPIPKTPSCPLHSRYDSLTDSCKCNYGYVYSGGKCISEDDLCQNMLGFSSRYNSLTDSCECSYGYVIDPITNKCISGNQHCRNKYGIHSTYKSYSKSCECSYGYIFNNSATKCISKDEACQEELGFNSEYDILSDSCVCEDGYVYKYGECTLDTSDFIIPNAGSGDINIPDSKEFLPTFAVMPTSIPTSVLRKRSTPTPRIPTLSPILTPTPALKNHKPPYFLNHELSLGSRGEDVEILQSALSTDKDVFVDGMVPGFFGRTTEEAVKKFQKKHGLEVTGAFNTETLAKFNKVFADSKGQNNSTKSLTIEIVKPIWEFIIDTWEGLFKE